MIAVTVIETPQPSWMRQLLSALMWPGVTERHPRFKVRIDVDGETLVSFDVDSLEDATAKKERLERELAAMGASDFSERYGFADGAQ